MGRLHARPALCVLIVGAVLWLTGCSDGPTTTTARVTSAAPATTSAEAPSTQSASDAAGDVKGEDGEAPPAALKSVGDIESVRLSLDNDKLALQVGTLAAPPDALPVEQLVFVLSMRMDEENGYELSAVALPGWGPGVVWESTYLYDVGTTLHKGLSEKPSATGNVLSMAVPLAQMPKLKLPFRWNVRSEWRKDGVLFQDRVPDGANDPLNPTRLQFPPES